MLDANREKSAISKALATAKDRCSIIGLGLRSNNIALGRVCSIIGVLSPDSAIPIRKQAVKNLCSRIAQEDFCDDMQKTMALLTKMKEDNRLEVRFRTDEQGTIESMLWCTGKVSSADSFYLVLVNWTNILDLTLFFDCAQAWLWCRCMQDLIVSLLFTGIDLLGCLQIWVASWYPCQWERKRILKR